MPLFFRDAMQLMRMRMGKLHSIERGLVIYHPLTSALATLPTGQSVTITGESYAATTYQGIPCVAFDASGVPCVFSIPMAVAVTSDWNCTVSLWLATTWDANNYNGLAFASIGKPFTSASRGGFAVRKRSSGITRATVVSGGGAYDGPDLWEKSDTSFHHVCLLCSRGASPSPTTRVSASLAAYVDGEPVGTGACSDYRTYNVDAVEIGVYGTAQACVSYASAFRVWNRHLTAAEIATLASEFTPQTT